MTLPAKCDACPRMCGVDRRTDAGFCGVKGEKIKIAKVMIHKWEEPCISGGNGAGTVFFSGCSLRCVFCQNYAVSHDCIGDEYSVDELCDIFKRLEADGADNIDLVTPTHYAYHIMAALDKYRPSVPVIWNSGGYERVEMIRRLKDYVDVYMPDLKYISNEKAKAYSAAEDYFAFASEAIKEMCTQTGPAVFDEKGLIKRGTIVRHLVLPASSVQSVRLLRWISENLPGDVYVSLMGQYIPQGEALNGSFPELKRRLTYSEYRRAQDALRKFGIENGYSQELSSSSTEFIPDFMKKN